MKYICLLAFLFGYLPFAFTQNFSPLSTGAIVNTPSDSRSVNIIDANGDGWEDVFISNGLKDGQKDLLYLNDSTGNFILQNGSDISTDKFASVGATAADFDNDGDVDIYVTNWYGQKNKLYLNDGAANFTATASVTTANGTYSETASWGDFDKDGLVDLLVTNSEGNPKANDWYRNLGTAGFQRQQSNPLTTLNNISRNVNWVDYDNDGDQDLYITNEGSGKNELYRNDQETGFTKIVDEVGINAAFSTMTSSWGDVDNDGDLDLFLGNAGFYVEKPNHLFRNRGDGTFESIQEGAIASANGCNYGSTFGDVDNDGDLDLLVTSAFCAEDQLRDILYLNDGSGIFTKDENWYLQNKNSASYGTAMGDLNNDGFLDIVVAHCKNATASPEPANEVWINEGNANHWLKIRLEGNPSNRSALGARVFISYKKDGQTVLQMREINSQSGYSGQNSLVVHFGLGTLQEVEEVLVHWPSGNMSSLPNQAADQLLLIKETITSGSGQVREQKDSRAAIFPNPVSKSTGSLTLVCNELTDGEWIDLVIYSAEGKTVWSDSLRATSEDFAIDWPNGATPLGTYSLVVRAENQILGTHQIVVKP